MISFNLEKALDLIGYSMNKFSILADVRPNTINDLVNGKTKRIEIDTIDKILNALNEITALKGVNRQFKITDIIEHTPDNGYVVDEKDNLIPIETYKKIKEILLKSHVFTDIVGLESTNCLELMTLYEKVLATGVYDNLDRTENKEYKQVNSNLLKIGTKLEIYDLVYYQKIFTGTVMKLSEKGHYFMSLIRNNNLNK